MHLEMSGLGAIDVLESRRFYRHKKYAVWRKDLLSKIKLKFCVESVGGRMVPWKVRVAVVSLERC